MIKLLVDAHYFDGFYAGATTYLKGLYAELVRQDRFDIYLAASDLDRLKENFPDGRFKFIRLKEGSNIRRLLFEFPRIIREGKFDYAHFTYFVPFIKTCRFIVTIHDLLFLDYPQYFSLKYRIGRTGMFYLSSVISDEVLTVSAYSKQSLIQHFRLRDEKIHITPNSFFISDASPSLSRRIFPGNYLLYVSRIEPRKNHLSLVKAFAELGLYQSYSLLLIGKESIRVPELSQYISSLQVNVREKIIFIPNVTEDELCNYYKYSSLFVFPSFAEGFGIPPLEAIAMGTKVICSNTTSLKEFTFLSRYQFDPYDLGSLRSSIMATLNDDHYPKEEILARVREQYSWKAAAETLSNLLI
jgi:glycosyltransferase involved in cell wall biosynthesis